MKKTLAAAAVALFLAASSIGMRAQQTVQAAAPAAQAPAAPAAAATGVNGAWHFVLDTPGGDREVEASFAVDADGKVTGNFGKSVVDGTFKDGELKLAFQFSSDETGTTDTMAINGKLDSSQALIGTWQFSTYDGALKATRPKQ